MCVFHVSFFIKGDFAKQTINCPKLANLSPKNSEVYICFARRVKAPSLSCSYQSSWISLSIALYPSPNAGERRTERRRGGREEGEEETKRGDREGARREMVHVHAYGKRERERESSQFERVSGLKIAARGSRVI